MQTHFARDAADLWILVVFHDPSLYWTLSLHKILPRFIPRPDAEVDALLDFKLPVYDLHIVMKIGSPNVSKSGQGTCWIKLPMTSEWDGKLGSRKMGLRGRALVQRQRSQPLESPLWSK